MTDSLGEKLASWPPEAVLLTFANMGRGVLTYDLDGMLADPELGIEEATLNTPPEDAPEDAPTYDKAYRFSSNPFGTKSVKDGKDYDLAYMYTHNGETKVWFHIDHMFRYVSGRSEQTDFPSGGSLIGVTPARVTETSVPDVKVALDFFVNKLYKHRYDGTLGEGE